MCNNDQPIIHESKGKTMRTTYTPGPWEYRDGKTNFNEIGPVSGSSWICRIPENTANAKLIVAAPDLLAALHKIINHWDDLHPKDRQQARMAIEKAEKGPDHEPRGI